MRSKDALGRLGEDLAAAHLDSAGLTVLDRNWRCRQGELDIVALDGTTVVFCEVKTRSSTAFGAPAEAVAPAKAARIRRLAAQWLAAHREVLVAPFPEVRFDVVSVLGARGRTPRVEHLSGVF